MQGGKVEKATKFDKISTLIFILLNNAFSQYMNFITAQNPDQKSRKVKFMLELNMFLWAFGHPNVHCMHAMMVIIRLCNSWLDMQYLITNNNSQLVQHRIQPNTSDSAYRRLSSSGTYVMQQGRRKPEVGGQDGQLPFRILHDQKIGQELKQTISHQLFAHTEFSYFRSLCKQALKAQLCMRKVISQAQSVIAKALSGASLCVRVR